MLTAADPISIALTALEVAELGADRYSRTGAKTTAIVDAAFARADVRPDMGPNGLPCRGGSWNYDLTGRSLIIYPYASLYA